MKKLLIILPLVFLLCFTLVCQKAEEVAEEPAVDVEAEKQILEEELRAMEIAVVIALALEASPERMTVSFALLTSIRFSPGSISCSLRLIASMS